MASLLFENASDKLLQVKWQVKTLTWSELNFTKFAARNRGGFTVETS
jgi:hypothetical protein